MKGVNIFLADGFEDCEALAVNDVLRRGGVECSLISVNGTQYVTSSHGVMVKAHTVFTPGQCCDSACEDPCEKDFMIFPGGMPGSRNLAECAPLMEMMKRHYEKGGSVAAICAAPGLVLSRLPSLEGVHFTCFDGFQEYLLSKGAVFEELPSVVSGRIITGRSAGHAVSFGLDILAAIKGEEAAANVEYSMYLY